MVVQYAVIEYADRGIYFDQSSGTVSHSFIQHNRYGVYVYGDASPLLENNAITNNQYGVYLQGRNNDAENPRPTIIQNDLVNNSIASVYLTGFGVNSSIVVDLTGNWWGTDTPVINQDIKFGSGMPSDRASIVDISNAATEWINSIDISDLDVSGVYFSPNGDGIKDSIQLSAALTEPSDWTVSVKDITGTEIKAMTGYGINLAIEWDGTDAGLVVMGDGVYSLTVTATVAGRTTQLGYLNVVLDNSIPFSSIDNIASGMLLRDVLEIPINGSATDDYFILYSIDYRRSGEGELWSNIIQSTSPRSQALLGSWALSSDSGIDTALANGDYILRLAAEDRAGNVGIDEVHLTIDNLRLWDIAPVSRRFNPENQTFGLGFAINMPATVTLRMYAELAGLDSTPLKEITHSFADAGAYELHWDGRNEEGDVVEAETYLYTLEATDGNRSAQYRPVNRPDVTVGVGSGINQFNVFKNEHWKLSLTIPVAGRGKLKLALGSPYNQAIYPYGEGLPMEPGPQTLVWNGVLPDTGEFFIGTFTTSMNFTAFPENYVLVDSDAPIVAGSRTEGPNAPYVEVKADPYLIYLSYGQFTRIKYHIDREALVLIKLLPPGVVDPNDPSAILVSNGTVNAGEQVVEWTGMDGADGTNTRRTLGDSGVHSFIIEASTVASGATTVYRGVLNAYQ